MRFTAINLVERAIHDAALGYYVRLGHSRVSMDHNGKVIVPDADKIDLNKFSVFSGAEGKTLWEWEVDWRGFLAGRLGQEFDAEAFNRASRSLQKRKPAKKANQTSNLLSCFADQSRLSPLMIAALSETENT